MKDKIECKYPYHYFVQIRDGCECPECHDTSMIKIHKEAGCHDCQRGR